MLPPINLQLHDNHPSLPFLAMVGCHVLGILPPAPSSATHFCFLPHRRSIIVALVAGRRPHSPPNCQPQKPCSHCHLLHPCCHCHLPIVFIARIDGWLLCSPPPLMPPPLVLSTLCLCLSMYNLSAPPPLVRWRLSSGLPLVHQLVVVSPLVAPSSLLVVPPPHAFIPLTPPLFVLADGCHIASCRTTAPLPPVLSLMPPRQDFG